MRIERCQADPEYINNLSVKLYQYIQSSENGSVTQSEIMTAVFINEDPSHVSMAIEKLLSQSKIVQTSSSKLHPKYSIPSEFKTTKTKPRLRLLNEETSPIPKHFADSWKRYVKNIRSHQVGTWNYLSEYSYRHTGVELKILFDNAVNFGFAEYNPENEMYMILPIKNENSDRH